MYLWTAAALAVGVSVVVLGWHSQGGTTNPTTLPPGHRLSPTTVVLNSAILVFREGLETILVLAAVTASFLGGDRVYRRPVAAGGGLAILAGIGTWFFVVWLIGRVHGSELDIQAATGLPSLLVLLLVMNWFFHKIYWTGWISHHHKRRKGLLSGGRDGSTRAMMLGLVLLGFTSVYRESVEIVIFLQNLRELYGSSVVVEGIVLGAMFTAAVGVLTFTLHQKLPYRRLLIITGAMLLLVLLVSVGEEVQEMQLAGWIGTTNLPGISFPGWMGTWFSLFGNWETIAAQFLACLIVVGSYLAAQYFRVWRPRRRGEQTAVAAQAPPERAAGVAMG
jgi:high-affinity iron transporter